eukprot:scaffold56571_cov36-Phaeocystis_antarctica.AAC.2
MALVLPRAVVLLAFHCVSGALVARRPPPCHWLGRCSRREPKGWRVLRARGWRVLLHTSGWRVLRAKGWGVLASMATAWSLLPRTARDERTRQQPRRRRLRLHRCSLAPHRGARKRRSWRSPRRAGEVTGPKRRHLRLHGCSLAPHRGARERRS